MAVSSEPVLQSRWNRIWTFSTPSPSFHSVFPTCFSADGPLVAMETSWTQQLLGYHEVFRSTDEDVLYGNWVTPWQWVRTIFVDLVQDGQKPAGVTSDPLTAPCVWERTQGLRRPTSWAIFVTRCPVSINSQVQKGGRGSEGGGGGDDEGSESSAGANGPSWGVSGRWMETNWLWPPGGSRTIV